MPEKTDTKQAALLHRLLPDWWRFAAIALILGAFGLYGVIASSVSQPNREIGVRPAQIGLHTRNVSGWMVHSSRAGLLGGIIIVHTRFAVRCAGLGAVTLSLVALLLAFASMAASSLPARRAASVYPVEVLRAE